jgi:hypothetical protein
MRRRVIAAGTVAAGMLTTATPAYAQANGTQPAGGAALGEAIGATAGAIVATALVILLISRHRAGRTDILKRFGKWAEHQTGLPAWASVPSMLLGVSLLVAVLGMYWDISLHIDNGRDPGPLANPAHYLILVGLYGVLVAGVLSIVLAGTERPSKTAIHLGGDWWAPIGGAMMAACGAFALSGFPLDDIWHRLFGEDVTLWGPTHLFMIGGAGFSTLGLWMLHRHGAELGRPRNLVKKGELRTAGALLIGPSTFQAEFDFGVPQFQLLYQPILIAFAAGLSLVAARCSALGAPCARWRSSSSSAVRWR